MEFIKLDQDLKKISIEPLAANDYGVYDQLYLKFYFEEFEDRWMEVKIIANVLEC